MLSCRNSIGSDRNRLLEMRHPLHLLLPFFQTPRNYHFHQHGLRLRRYLPTPKSA